MFLFLLLLHFLPFWFPSPPQTDQTISQKNLNKVWLHVEGMTCPLGCPLQVKKALAKFQGVTKVNVFFEEKKVQVFYQKDSLTLQDLIQALTKAGFQGSSRN